MRKIIAPIKPADQGPEVANLQDALQFLIERGKLVVEPVTRDGLLRDLDAEKAHQVYGVALRAIMALAHFW